MAAGVGVGFGPAGSLLSASSTSLATWAALWWFWPVTSCSRQQQQQQRQRRPTDGRAGRSAAQSIKKLKGGGRRGAGVRAGDRVGCLRGRPSHGAGPEVASHSTCAWCVLCCCCPPPPPPRPPGRRALRGLCPWALPPPWRPARPAWTGAGRAWHLVGGGRGARGRQCGGWGGGGKGGGCEAHTYNHARCYRYVAS